jgi:phenylpyruvate tautomerase PptA (4-oxalocrotonate tautomerase family)
MPICRVTCPEHALTAEQKEKLAPLLLEAEACQEVDPVTDEARAVASIWFNEIPLRNCFPSKEPFLLVEMMTFAGFFTQARRDAAQAAITKAFTSVLGDDGSSTVMNGVRVAPAYLARLYSLLIENPEGSFAAGGAPLSALEVGHLIGSDKDPQRWSELKENTAKLTAARLS